MYNVHSNAYAISRIKTKAPEQMSPGQKLPGQMSPEKRHLRDMVKARVKG